MVAPVPFIIITRASAAGKFGAVVPWPGIPCQESFIGSRWESGIVCVTAVPGIGFRSQAPPTTAAAVPRHPNEHDAGPPSRGCRLALGLGWGRQPPPQRHRSLAVVVLEAFTHRRDRPDPDPERSPGVAWHKRQNVIKLGSHIPPPVARCSPCTLSVWSGTTPNREK